MDNRIVIRSIKLPFDTHEKEALDAAFIKAKKAGIKLDRSSLHIHKRSVDARRGRSKDSKPSFIYSVIGIIDSLPTKEKLLSIDAVLLGEDEDTPIFGSEKIEGRPIIVGMGPCGMFASLILAKYGYRPIVIERGADVENRRRAIERFYSTHVLEESNIQFGAGGAGTFSDGKLVTRINDPKCSFVLKTMHELGAPQEVLYMAKPHVGTDKLFDVVNAADERIRELGGEIRYNTCLCDISVKNGKLDKAVLSDGSVFSDPVLVLAIGHSARDTYEMLYERGVTMTAKPFSVGVRVEHFQKSVDESLYGEYAGDPRLPAGEYNLSYRKADRGVYTFCMCPGGEVVAAASEDGGVVTNGMSRYKRDGLNANAAIAVSVLPEDFGNTPLDAIAYQRNLERSAYKLGGLNFAAPCMTVGDFIEGKECGLSEPATVMPTYMNGNIKPAPIQKLFAPYVNGMLLSGLSDFARKMRCFSDKNAILTGVETRTSAPLRILRTDEYTALGIKNLYPCGEGAGYAGGITSAAVDGINIAYAIMKKWSPQD
ncbi:MAG: hypothetical protein E7635_05005 [Ruminococcaceae bacterium]|nr:hypothetical protein [Oscillospiraceae bacterium]